mgnify:CR=1 FL=1
MNRRILIYGALSFLVVIGIVLFFFAAHSEILQIITAIPLVGALVAILVQILRDEAAYHKTLMVEQQKHQNAIATSSHMATVAFDRHVEFCEAYVTGVYGALSTLMRGGPTEGVLEDAGNLVDIREKHALWVTPSIEEALMPFEQALRTIGANAYLVEAIRTDIRQADQRQKALDEMYNTFAQVMGFSNWAGKELTEELAMRTLVGKVRAVLGVQALTDLRRTAIEKAHSSIK